jgi:L-ascorbate metabolism protein UlaG (beta-lactamase superfamily)
MKKSLVHIFLFALVGIVLSACQPAVAPVTPTLSATLTPLPPTDTPTIPPTNTPVPPPANTPVGLEEAQQMVKNIAWLRSSSEYGSTGIKIQTAKLVIYLDPTDLTNLAKLPKADIILVSHMHDDHYSKTTIAALSKATTKIVSIDMIANKFKGNGVTLTPGEKVVVNDLEIEGVAAYNSSHEKYLKNLGFILTIDGFRIYLSGDTALNPELEALTNIDIAFLNVRAGYSLSGEDVVNFARLVQPKIIIPIHWMPDNDTYNDRQEIDYIQKNIPASTRFEVLDLDPKQP